VRAKRGQTQADAAAAIGCTAVTLSNWENGHRVPNLQNLKKLSNAYGLSIDRLVSKPIQRVRLNGTKKGRHP